jgi:hypothetical protein
VNLQENVDPELLSSMREGLPSTLQGVPSRKNQENDAIPKIAPKWLKYDRQVSLSDPQISNMRLLSLKPSYLKLLKLLFKFESQKLINF